MFGDRLEQPLARGDRDVRSVGGLFLDVDHCNLVDDSLSHQQGDALLAEMAVRIHALSVRLYRRLGVDIAGGRLVEPAPDERASPGAHTRGP